MTSFSGYPHDALPLLAEIGTHDKAWFAQHKPRYQDALAEPTKLLVTDLGADLQASVSRDLVAIPRVNASISPINNDLRFVQGPPYKDYVLLRFWEGPEKRAAPTLFVRLSPIDVGFGAGIAMDAAATQRYREAIAGRPGEELVRCLKELERDRDGDLVLAGEELKRVPAPYPADHPRAGLLRHKWFQVRWVEPVPPELAGERFVGWCAQRLTQLSDVHRWLRDHVRD